MTKETKDKILPFCEPVSQIVKPILESLTANGFTFMRIYEDGSRVFLSDSIPWVENFVDKNHFKISGYKKFSYIPKFTLWKHWPKQDVEFQKFMSDAKETFSHDNCLNIIKFQNNYLDSFSFRASENNDQINNIFLNNIEPIESFIEFFLFQAQNIIAQAENSKIIIDENKIMIRKEIMISDSKEIEISKTISETDRILVLDEMCTKKLSLRESECLILRYKGLTNKLIAQQLNISKRTVEQYIENIKNKIGKNNLPDVLNYILKFRKNRYLIMSEFYKK